MNILDLKKLMLVPLACCVLVQQADAATQEDKGAKNWILTANSTKEIIPNFINLVKDEETNGSTVTVTDKNGRPITNENGEPVPVSENLRVAATINLAGSGLGLNECQLGGLIASVKDTKRSDVSVFKGVKAMNVAPADNRTDLYATTKGSHTERQLVGRVLKEWGTLSGRHFIYTALPPCARGRIADVGNIDCCEYYCKLLAANQGAEFHIFFRTPKLETLNGYARFETYKKLRCLWAFVIDILGEGAYEAARTMVKGILTTDARLNILDSLRRGVEEMDAGEGDCLEVARFLFECMRRVMRNEVQIHGDNYTRVKRCGSGEYAASVTQLYRALVECYAEKGKDLSKIHFYSLNI